jgi:hypothetical protein
VGSPFETFATAGADLSGYREQLHQDRSTRTLTIRRSSRLSINGSGRPSGSRSSGVTEIGNSPLLDAEKALEALQSGDNSTISSLAEQATHAARTCPRLLNSLTHSIEFLEALSGSLADRPPFQVCRLIDLISALFPRCGSLTSTFVDGGIVFAIPDLLGSSEPAVVLTALQLVIVLSEKSSYGRDAVLCMDIQTVVINLAQSDGSKVLIDRCCECLLAMFSNRDEIDEQVVTNAARAMFPLLQLKSTTAVSWVLDCFVKLSNGDPALIFLLFDLGMDQLAVKLLENEALVNSTLKLIGNLCVGEPNHIRTMLDAGLMQKLFEFADSECSGDVFWVLSNLLETAPNVIQPLITDEFVTKAIQITSSASFEIQKESVFFLATIIHNSGDSTLTRIMLTSVITVLVEMLDCGVDPVVMRCMETLRKFCQYAQQHAEIGGEVVELLNECDVNGQLDELLGHEASMVTEQAELLQMEYQALQGSVQPK